MEKSKKQRLKRKLDRLIQDIYQKKYPICLVCGQPTTEMHHFIQKSQSLALRWDEKNLIPLCQSCHYKIHRIGDAEIISTIIRKKGEAWEKYIYAKRRTTFNDNLGNLREVEQKLLDIL